VAEHLDGVLTGFVVDTADADLVDELQVPAIAVNTLMVDMRDKAELAQAVLDFARALQVGHRQPQPRHPLSPSAL
jgi:hypothetical protein